MENQGYEEDQSRASEKQSTLESCRRDQQLRVDTIDVIDDPAVARTTTHPEGHVYEDIAIGARTDACEIPERTSCSDETPDPRETRIDIARQAWTSNPSSPTIESFQQSSTLFSSAGISTNHDSATISSASKTSEDVSEKAFGNREPRELAASALPGHVSSSPRTKDDSSQDTSVTQSDRRPNRRRRKKDCKHCRSKLAGSCEKLDELMIDGKDTILKEKGNDHSDKHPDTSTLLFRESLLRSQNIKIYPVVSRTSLRDTCGAKRNSSAFPASEYGVHATENPAKYLLNVENNRMFGQVVDSAQSKILGVSGNVTDMRINSIYSQDRWYGKDSQIFYTDVKDQNPFQVSCIGYEHRVSISFLFKYYKIYFYFFLYNRSILWFLGKFLQIILSIGGEKSILINLN